MNLLVGYVLSRGFSAVSLRCSVQLAFTNLLYFFSFSSSTLGLNGVNEDHCAREEHTVSIKNSKNEYRALQTLIAVVYLLLVGLLGIATAAAETTDRRSNSAHYSEGGRARTQSPNETVDQYEALKIDGVRGASSGSVTSGKPGEAMTASSAKPNDFWFYSVDVILFGDDDNDGHFFGVDLLFDVDTAWSAVDVYAVTYLSFEGGPWNEYGVTEDFTLFDTSADDEYNIVTELESGYLFGSYDLLVEIFDAQTGDFLVGMGPEDSSELGFLPLEDLGRDAPIVLDHHSGGGGGGGGGSTSLWLLAVLLLIQSARWPGKRWVYRTQLDIQRSK